MNRKRCLKNKSHSSRARIYWTYCRSSTTLTLQAARCVFSSSQMRSSSACHATAVYTNQNLLLFHLRIPRPLKRAKSEVSLHCYAHTHFGPGEFPQLVWSWGAGPRRRPPQFEIAFASQRFPVISLLVSGKTSSPHPVWFALAISC